jgi:ketosteroid isomerase-like protein
MEGVMPSLIKTSVMMPIIFAFSLSCGGEETGAQGLDAAWVAAMKANDVDALVRTYASDAVAWLPGTAEARGEKAIRAVFADMMAANTIEDVVLTQTEYRTEGDMSVGWGRFLLTLKPKAGGAPVVTAGRYIDVAERDGDAWHYVSDHASAEPAPAPAK